MKKLLSIILFASCAAPLHKSGNYLVKTADKKGSSTWVTFEGVKGKYQLPSDTIKVGDKVDMIKVNRLK